MTHYPSSTESNSMKKILLYATLLFSLASSETLVTMYGQRSVTNDTLFWKSRTSNTKSSYVKIDSLDRVFIDSSGTWVRSDSCSLAFKTENVLARPSNYWDYEYEVKSDSSYNDSLRINIDTRSCPNADTSYWQCRPWVKQGHHKMWGQGKRVIDSLWISGVTTTWTGWTWAHLIPSGNVMRYCIDGSVRYKNTIYLRRNGIYAQ